jgi:ABC-2 type transport system ATP-binding protein
MLAVTNEHIDKAVTLGPLFKNSMMGLTTMLFDSAKLEHSDKEVLQGLGQISVPSLADIFVGVMSKEIC